MKEYLYNHNYVSENKKSNYQQELSVERAECIINKHNSLIQEEKQQLISFLEDKIKEYKEYIDTYKKEKIGNCKLYCEAKLFVYQEVLDFIEKGGKK